MNYTETTTRFACAGDWLTGIVTQPGTPTDTGVVVLVGGPQYRAGSHRQFVRLSRQLAATGCAVLRFDYRGMGDSEGDPRDFEHVSADIGAAIDALQKHQPQLRHVILWGLCDGASAALLYHNETRDPRVSALCLLNPWVRSASSLARTQVKHYYLQRLRQKEFWRKLLRGGVAWQALRGFTRSLGMVWSTPDPAPAREPAPFQARMAAACRAFDGPVFLVLSGEDYIAKEFLEYTRQDSTWKKALARPRLVRYDLPGADHTFSDAHLHAQVEHLTQALVRQVRQENTCNNLKMACTAIND